MLRQHRGVRAGLTNGYVLCCAEVASVLVQSRSLCWLQSQLQASLCMRFMLCMSMILIVSTNMSMNMSMIMSMIITMSMNMNSMNTKNNYV